MRNLLPLIAAYLEYDNLCSILVEYNMIDNHKSIPENGIIYKHNAEDLIQNIQDPNHVILLTKYLKIQMPGLGLSK